MLREMRDAAGDSGEFYTPRPVIRFMVEVTDPKLGETILDPAAGTGGFLVEAYTHLQAQCNTVQDHRILQEKSILGGEAKPLPYMLCQMNLLLHGLEYPRIDPQNSLRFKLTEIGDKGRVDLILTNPPFGGEEEAGIKANFPQDKQTGETALLFLQLIMRKLRRRPTTGRAAVVVPNGTLFGDGVCARIKEELLKEFNLHTIVRLPNGVFAPYAPIQTNLLFLDAEGPTKEIWFYELPPPEGRKNYSKTKPVQYGDFANCLKWWKRRKANDRAWKLKAEDVLRYDPAGNLVSCNLDVKNPNGCNDIGNLSPERMVCECIEKQDAALQAMREVMHQMHEMQTGNSTTMVPLREILTPVSRAEIPLPGKTYRQLGVRLWGVGAYERESMDGAQTKYRKLSRVEAGDLVMNKIWARNGSVAVVPAELSGCYVSAEFPTYVPVREKLLPSWMAEVCRSQTFWIRCDEESRGTSGKNRIRPEKFLAIEIPLPPLGQQQSVAELQKRVQSVREIQAEAAAELDALLPAILDKGFKGKL